MTPERRTLLAILAAIVAAFLGYRLLLEFHDWNSLQNCATGGGRNCGMYNR
jgi:hypothetical protein